MKTVQYTTTLIATFFCLILAHCNGDDAEGGNGEETYAVGGSVTGLKGTLVLQNNGGDDLTVDTDGAFAFATELADGAAYEVTVLTQPDAQTCKVTKGSGAVAGADVTDVAVTCTDDAAPTSYAVGGSVTGLKGTLVLQNNGGDDLTVDTDGAFAFATELADAAAYEVTVLTQPDAQTCEVADGSGTIDGADVTGVAVTCTDDVVPTYAVGGSVTGLKGTLVLQNNGGDDLTVDTDGAFVFATEIEDGAAYEVTVLTKPDAQTCEVADGSGTIDGDDISDVAVSCRDKWTNPDGVSDMLSASGFDSSDQMVAMDNNGNAIIVWTENNNTIRAMEYRSGTWEAAFTLNPDGLNSSYPAVAMSDSGEAVVAWTGIDTDDAQHIYAATYNGEEWETPTDDGDYISPSGRDSQGGLDVAMDPLGNAIVAWRQFDEVGTHTHIFKAEYRSDVWTTPSSTSDHISANGGWAFNPKIAMNADGDAIIVWYQGSESNWYQIYKVEYRNDQWSTVSGDRTDHISFHGDTDDQAIDPDVAMDDNGDAIIVWRHFDGSEMAYNILKSELRNDVWTHPTDFSDAINPPALSMGVTQVAVEMDSNGNAIIAWIQSDGTFSQIFMSEYRNSTWTDPADIDDHISFNGENASDPKIAMSEDGTAMLAWSQTTDSGAGSVGHIFVASYENETWDFPATIGDHISPNSWTPSDAWIPSLAMDDNGNAIVAWIQNDGTDLYGIFKSEYRP